MVVPKVVWSAALKVVRMADLTDVQTAGVMVVSMAVLTAGRKVGQRVGQRAA